MFLKKLVNSKTYKDHCDKGAVLHMPPLPSQSGHDRPRSLRKPVY